jgi:hypothetical protein
MVKRFIFLSWLLSTLVIPKLHSQARIENRNNFFEAESWILFEDYKEALPLYLQLSKIYPNNANFKYRIGQCYINTDGEKEKAVTYLEDAAKKINPEYKEGKFSEAGAPYDVLYYLANAYRINKQLDKALETYKRFKENLNPSVYDTAIVNLQIKSCLNAKDLMSKPLFVREKNLGEMINEGNSEFNPVVSDDEKLLVFSRSEAFYDAILYSTKVNGKWSAPLNMNELLKVDRDLFPTSISSDGKDLYLYSSADYDGIIYTTRFENGVWSALTKLNENINTKYWESHATISHDNKKLFFTSNRKGTLGGLDIYVSNRDSTGNWGPAINLGPVINTPYNEESPFLSKDDKTLFFSSRGHLNMGGYDIFYSTLQKNGEWSIPLNAGYPLNSTDDDVFFKAINDGYEGYFAKDDTQGFGKQDIYHIEIYSDDHPRRFSVRGVAKIADLLSNIKDSVKISALNTKDRNQIVVVYSNPVTGEYEFEVPQGNYEVTYEAKGGERTMKTLNLPLSDPSDSFLLPSTILPKTDFVADLSVENSKTISVSKGDSILFPLKVEPNSKLSIEHWLGDSLLSVKEYFITDSIFSFKMLPAEGDNKLVFKLTDRFNNITSTEVYIKREKEISSQPVIRPEYSHVIADKQARALSSMLSNRAEKDLSKVISQAKLEKQHFGKVDELIDYLKKQAEKKGIPSENVDKLALKVATMDNVLTQAAVDYMARHTEGNLSQILSNIDINKANLKTWNDLQEYINSATNGFITPDDLSAISHAILSETDPSIIILEKRIIAFSEKSADGNLIRQVLAKIDTKGIKSKDEWLKAFIDEAHKAGISDEQVAKLLVSISSKNDSSVAQFLEELKRYAEEPLLSVLKSLDLKKEKIRTPQELILFLLNNKDKLNYSKEAVFKTISNMIVAKDTTQSDTSAEQQLKKAEEKNNNWFIIIIGAIITACIIFILSRNKKKQSSDK